jgi:hypothetical protein
MPRRLNILHWAMESPLEHFVERFQGVAPLEEGLEAADEDQVLEKALVNQSD